MTGPVAPGPDADLDRTGLTAALGAFTLWGLLPLFLMTVEAASPLEVLAHRALWAVPTVGLGLVLAGAWRSVWTAVRRPGTLGVLAATAALMAMNWLVFIWAVSIDRVMEASLAYFITPLVNVAVGVAFMNERFGPARRLAVGLAGLGVLNQVFVVGEPPVIAAVLAASFATYTVLRKTAAVEAGPGLFVETLFMAPAMVLALIWLAGRGPLIGLGDPVVFGLLMLAGPVTAAPLFLFATAARRLPLSVLGVAQFLAPTMHFATAIVSGEAFSWALAVTFGLIWLGVAVFVWDLRRHERRANRNRREAERA